MNECENEINKKQFHVKQNKTNTYYPRTPKQKLRLSYFIIYKYVHIICRISR